MPNLRHKVDDWLALMEPLNERDLTGPRQGATGVAEFEPLLKVTEEERSAAAAKLRANGIGEDDLLIGIHGGASDIRRRWPLDKFQNVAGALSANCGAKVLFFLEPDAPERTSDVASVSMQTSLREMMALLTHCDLFLCNDSGPMHVADALGVPVVAVFLTGNPAWHRPFRRGQIVVGEGTGHDFLIAPQEHDVLIAAESVLARRRKALPTVFLPGGSPE